jgi:hypothetical protein
MYGIIFRQGRNAVEILKTVTPSPSLVLRCLHEFLLSDYISEGSRGAEVWCLPNFSQVFEKSPESTLEARGGIGQLGPWTLTRTRSKKLVHTSRMLVHWPTLLREADDLMLAYPPMAFYLLSLRDVLYRKSPFVYYALHRKYITDLHRFGLNNGAELQETPETYETIISEEESRVLKDMLKKLANDELFIYALQRASCEIYLDRPRASEIKSVSVYRGNLPKASAKHCSMLLPARKDVMSEIPESLDKMWNRVVYLEQHYGPKELKPFLEELLIARDIAEAPTKSYVDNQIRKMGVARAPAKTGSPPLFFINWDKWYEYRYKSHRRDYYIGLFGKKAQKERTLTPKDAVPWLGTMLQGDYPSIVSGLAARPDIIKRLTEYWRDELKDERLVSVINLKALDKIVRQLAARGWGEHSKHNQNRKHNNPVDPLYLRLTLNGFDGRTYEVTAVHFGRTAKFIPSWEMTNASIYHPISDRVSSSKFKKRRAGVFTVPVTGALCYTAKFLVDQQLSPQTPRDSALYTELLDAAKNLKRRQFPQALKKPEGGRGLTFRPEEDRAIIRLYRPKLTDEQWSELLGMCHFRDKEGIRRRAATLCRKLIDKGVYDIDELPHGQRNINLNKTIAEAKKAAQRRSAHA